MISGIVLAAGTSSRMGSPKQLLSYRGFPLLQHVIDRAGPAGLDELLVVLGHAAPEITEAIELPRYARIVVNTSYESGHASSLRLGLDSVSPRARAAMIFLGDQPDLRTEVMEAVSSLYAKTGGPVVRAEYRGDPGHPVMIDRSIWGEVSDSSGDRGAGPVLDQHPEWVVPAAVDLPPPLEVDTPEDFRALVARDPETT